jgi:hypothetical protein
VAGWIQNSTLAIESEIEQMDAKVLLMLAVITDPPPGRPLAILDAPGSGTVRGRAGRPFARRAATHGRLRSDEMQSKRDVDRAVASVMGRE